MNLSLLPGTYAIYRFKPGQARTDPPRQSGFYSETVTGEEISVVTLQNEIPSENTDCSPDWRILKIQGILDLTMTGIAAEITAILKDNNIPVFIISTYNTDHFLVRQKDLNKAISALKEKGHAVF